MDVAAATSAAAANTKTAESTKGGAATASLASDFDNFLKLLTTQLKSQDPLSPMESTQFVEQLASFSSVEQQIQTNSKLDAIAAALGGGDLESIAQWVGKSVETRAEDIRFTGAPISFSTTDADSYDAVTAAIKDSNGDVVGRFAIDKKEDQHVWRGEDGAGGRVLDGDYTIELEYRRGSSIARTEAAPQFGTVDEARLTPDGWRLKLSSGAFIEQNRVTAILPSPSERT